MGTRGPIPKRSDQRHGHRSAEESAVDQAPGASEVEIPDADQAWHPIAREWYESLAESGQSEWYEPSDWRFARFVAELTSQALTASRLNGQLITAVMAGMTELLTTEGARRRARIELERGGAESPDPQAEHEATVTLLRSIGGNG